MKKAQNLIEYILIAALMAAFGYMALSKMDFGKIKNYVFMRPASSSDPAKIDIEAMTDVK